MQKLTLVFLVCGAIAGSFGFDGPGTTDNIRGKLYMRCVQFRAILHDEKLMSEKDRYSLPQCDVITKAFLGAFQGKGPCDVAPGSFKEVIAMTMKSLGPDKVTLWSGVYDYMKPMAKAVGLFALETGTFLGFMGDGLNFCGKVGGDGIDYEHCPKWGECKTGTGDALGHFWQSISTAFGATAEGRVRILMKGSHDTKSKWPYRPAYRPDSVLGSKELPMIFELRKVKSLEPLLTHIPGEEVRERCGEGSMLEMEHLIKKADIAYHCTDDPKPIMEYLCKKFPCDKEGKGERKGEGRGEGKGGYGIVSGKLKGKLDKINENRLNLEGYSLN